MFEEGKQMYATYGPLYQMRFDLAAISSNKTKLSVALSSSVYIGALHLLGHGSGRKPHSDVMIYDMV